MTKIIDRRNKSMGGGSKRSVSQIKNIAVHYSATSEGNTASFEKFWKGTRGWNTGGYHEVVLTNGDVELNYNPDTISNGVGGENTRMYNICYVGVGQPNAKQLQTLKERVNYNRKRFGLPVSAVKGHREYRGQSTQCPALNMTNFRNSLGATAGKPKPVTKPSGTGGSIVDYLNSKGINSSFANRKKLATKHGIKNYKGTAAQNTQLLNKLKSGYKPTGKSISTMAQEVIDGKHGNGHDVRRKSLGISRAQYKMVRKEVNKRSGSTAKPKGKSISQMATEIIDGKHGTGHANRRRSLGVSQSVYYKVRAEVNRRLK